MRHTEASYRHPCNPERSRVHARLKWFVLALPLAALLAVGGSWAYIEFLREDAPARRTTKTVTVDLLVLRNGANIEVNGAIPVVFARQA